MHVPKNELKGQAGREAAKTTACSGLRCAESSSSTSPEGSPIAENNKLGTCSVCTHGELLHDSIYLLAAGLPDLLHLIVFALDLLGVGLAQALHLHLQTQLGLARNTQVVIEKTER